MRVTHSKDRRQFTQHVSIRATAADGTTGVMPQNGSNWSAVTAVRALDSRVKDFERAACRLRRVARRRRPRPNLRVTSKARAPRTKAVAPRNASNQTGASTPAAASRPDTRPRRRARCMHRLLSLWRTWQRVWRRLRHSVWRRLRIHRACDPSASCDATDIGCFGRFDATDTSSGPCFAFVNRFPKKHRSLFADRLAPPRRRSRLGWFARWVHGCPHPPFPASQCVPPPPSLSHSLSLPPSGVAAGVATASVRGGGGQDPGGGTEAGVTTAPAPLCRFRPWRRTAHSRLHQFARSSLPQMWNCISNRCRSYIPLRLSQVKTGPGRAARPASTSQTLTPGPPSGNVTRDDALLLGGLPAPIYPTIH